MHEQQQQILADRQLIAQGVSGACRFRKQKDNDCIIIAVCQWAVVNPAAWHRTTRNGNVSSAVSQLLVAAATATGSCVNSNRVDKAWTVVPLT
jgi:hypothetical protein